MSYIQDLWNKTALQQRLTWLESSIFFALCVLEKIYQGVFFVVNVFKQRRKHLFFVTSSKMQKTSALKKSPIKVISVGNLSVGGTGKSVVVPFLIKALSSHKGSIFLRGYRSAIERSSKSIMISNGKDLLYDVATCGDEAYMLAQVFKGPLGQARSTKFGKGEHYVTPPIIIVGKKRVSSAQVLADYCAQEERVVDYVVLDDAYQNHQLKKDFEILLIDARHPLENGHCLPAGRLREKDYSRADAIILTHADALSCDKIQQIKTHTLAHFDSSHIFTGKHNGAHILLYNKGVDQALFLRRKKILLFAGIGSFSNFYASAQKFDLDIVVTREYKDHHHYAVDDVAMLYDAIQNNQLDGALTTAKDWCKIEPILKSHDLFKNMPIYVLNIEFEFLSAREYSSFMELMNRRLEL